ncbi:hypothetical protein ASF99_04945 [Exiguobacterium sp. Leaf187]|uniref:hypothetical protein n=1 Tax=Exiguobacterium sp. Leaf187 TaxID=1736294 RepID=UPI0006F82D3E|nr:hypothetical protein [Exiguobacterium sp. Leaf187]KQS19236.1 hypothetical protein ASF99_04945 [Exiguobacterium sp. Leaf187]
MPLYKNLDELANTLVDRFHENPTLLPLLNVEDVVSSIFVDVMREMVEEAEPDAMVQFKQMVKNDPIIVIDAVNKQHVLHLMEDTFDMHLLQMDPPNKLK